MTGHAGVLQMELELGLEVSYNDIYCPEARAERRRGAADEGEALISLMTTTTTAEVVVGKITFGSFGAAGSVHPLVNAQ